MEQSSETKYIELPKEFKNYKKKFKIPYSYHSVWKIVYLYDQNFIEWFRKKYMVPYVNEYISTRQERKNETITILRSLNTDEKTITSYEKEYDSNSVKYVSEYLRNPKSVEKELEKHGFTLDFLDEETDNYCRDTTKKSAIKTVTYILDRGVLCDVLVTRNTRLETDSKKHLVEESFFQNANYDTFNIETDHKYRVLEYSPNYKQNHSNLGLIEVIMYKKDIEYNITHGKWNCGMHTICAGNY